MKKLMTILVLSLGLSAYAQESFKDETSGKWGVKDTDGKILCEAKYDKIGKFSEGLAKVNIGGEYYMGGRWGFINQKGKEVIPLIYFYVQGDFENGRVSVRGKDKWGMIDKTGKEAISLKYDFPIFFDEVHNGLAPVCVNEKCGVINKSGKEIVPLIYDGIEPFFKGVVVVNKGGKYDSGAGHTAGGKWGALDTNGKLVVPIEFDWLFPVSDGKFNVNIGGQTMRFDGKYMRLDGGKWGVYDVTLGKILGEVIHSEPVLKK